MLNVIAQQLLHLIGQRNGNSFLNNPMNMFTGITQQLLHFIEQRSEKSFKITQCNVHFDCLAVGTSDWTR
jgi:hypothetical protein